MTRREAFVHVVDAASGAGGAISVQLRLYDAFTTTGMAGHPLVLTYGSQVVPLTTDAEGRASAAFTFEAGHEEVTATYAGDGLYEPTSTVKPLDAPLGDVVFIIDESGSMGPHIAAVRRNVLEIARQLGARTDFRLGLVGFGAGGTHSGHDGSGGRAHTHEPYTDDVETMAQSIDELVVSGVFEPGFHAVVHAMGEQMGYRPGAGVCAVLIGDEPPQSNTTFAPEQREDALAALRARDAVLFAIVGPDVATRNGYGPNPGSLTAETGGSAFPIATFATNPQPVLDALLTQCINRVIAPDLGVGVTADRNEVRPGEEITYTLTVGNAASGHASGTVLTATLPAGVTVVDASDGGTESGRTVQWPAFEVRSLASHTRTLRVRVDEGLDPSVTELVLAASVADDGANGADRNPADNSAEARTAVLAPLAAPLVDAGLDATIDQDASFALAPATFTDADDDTGHSATIDWGDGSPAGAGTVDEGAGTVAGAHTYLDAGVFTVTVCVRDGSGLEGCDQLVVTVEASNAPPVADAGGPYAGDEGSEVGLTATASSDPDGDPLQFAWDLDGDGDFDDAVGPTPVALFDDNGSYTVGVRVTDAEGSPDIATATVAVANVAPTASAAGDAEVVEGAAFTVTLVDPSDPSAADTAAGFSYAFDCGDGAGFGPLGTEPARSCPTDDDAVRSVRAQIADKDGGSSVVEATVTVRNAPPAITAFSATTALAGPMAFGSRFAAAFSDPGAADTHEATFGFPGGPVGVAPYLSGQEVAHRFDAPGCGVGVTVEVRDDDGGTSQASLTADVGSGTFLPPLREDRVPHATTAGQVVPVKVGLADCEGTVRTDLAPAIRVRAGDGVTEGAAMTGDELIPRTSAASQQHGVMGPNGNHYHYDLMADLDPGTWTILVYPFGTDGPSLRHLLEVQ